MSGWALAAALTGSFTAGALFVATWCAWREGHEQAEQDRGRA